MLRRRPVTTLAALTLSIEPAAGCAAYLQPRKPIVKGHEPVELLSQLELAGMRAASSTTPSRIRLR
ncbi:MAG: hypothetical protein AB7O13_19135 [Alphaproteobacteria bacterium]